MSSDEEISDDEILAEVLYELRPIFLEDDPEKLKAFLALKKVHGYDYAEVIRRCIGCGAKKCFFFLLSEDGFDIKKGYFPLGIFSTALSMDKCDPEIVDCLFRKFGGIKFANTHETGATAPLHQIASQLCSVYPLLTWTRGESLVKLLILICHPQLKKKLDCLRLLVGYTHSCVDVAISFVSSGLDVELAALLLVAARDFLPLLKSQLPKNLLYSVKDINGLSSQAILGKHIYPSGFGLIDIFDKAGDSLKEFYNSMPEDISSEDLIKGVGKILVEDAKISISEEDVDVAGILSVEPQMMPSIHKYLGIKPKDCVDESQKPMFPSVNSADYSYLCEPEASMARLQYANTEDQIKRFINARSMLRMGRHLYSTMAFQSPMPKFTSLVYCGSYFNIKWHVISGNET